MPCHISPKYKPSSATRRCSHLAVKQQVIKQGLIIEEENILPNGEIELVVCERF